MIFNAVKALRTAGGCILFLGLTVAVLAAQDAATTRTTLSVAANDAGSRTRLTLKAHVSVTNGGEAPSGVVNFRSGNQDLGSAVIDTEGNTSIATDVLPQGDHRLVAIYKGAEAYQASVSPEEQVHTNAASAIAGFTVSASPTSLSTTVGGFVSSVVTVTPVNGFNAVVSLSCAGLPVNTTCVFTPVNVTASCSTTACTPVTSVMQIQTQAPSSKAATGTTAAFVFPLLFGLAGLGAWRRQGWRNVAVVMLVFAGISGLSGCNARYYYLNHGPPGNPGTTVGTFAVTVESESSTGSSTTTPPTNPQITLTVKAS